MVLDVRFWLPERAKGEVSAEPLRKIAGQLARMEAHLAEVRQTVIERPAVKEWYSVDEVAQILGKAKLTIREHCRFDRIDAKKRQAGRGATSEWAISHVELVRLRNEGLRPLAKHVPDRL